MNKEVISVAATGIEGTGGAIMKAIPVASASQVYLRMDGRSAIRAFVERQQAIKLSRAEVEARAKLALPKLVDVCANKTGQSYHLRNLLFSLWNGKPVSLLDVVNLDYELREMLGDVVLAFGSDDFFYTQIAEAFEARGLFDWFRARGDER